MAVGAIHLDAAPNVYRVYGLTVASEIVLPELSLAERPQEGSSLSIDVLVELGQVPDALPGRAPSTAWAERQDRTCLLRFDGIGRMLVEDGRRIVVEKTDGASFDDLRTYLIGSALAAAAHQRGLVPLHVSAILTPVGVVAFTGESGAGKSTLAAHLNRAVRWPLISDDVSILHHESDGFSIESGVNTVKLWHDALRSLDRTSEGLRRDLTRDDKFHAVEPEKFLQGRFPLKRLVLLEWGDAVRLEQLSGRRAFQAALGAVYRPEFAALFSNRSIVVNAVMELAKAIEVLALVRPRSVRVEDGIAQSIASALSVGSE